MNPIRTNKPTFFGNDGDVLKSGQIFIGQPNQWPIDFPKTVTFQDSAGTQFTAQQPLTTNSQGQISYNGKAIIALVDGNYSMLVRDRNGVVVNDGYTPFVENTDSGGGGTTNATQVGTLLSDIKQFNVTPGDTVRNVGKTTALDDLGAYWLVVSNTGGGGDDIDLIDFANGTQGQRISNTLYSKDSGTAYQQDYDEQSVSLGASGDFTSLDFRCVKVGKQVTIHIPAGQPHSSTSLAISAVGAVPSGFRPNAFVTNISSAATGPSGPVRSVGVHADGRLVFNYIDWSGSGVNQGGTGASNDASITFMQP